MNQGLYKNVLTEFKSYLDSNHRETIYFEALRFKNLKDEDDDLAYSEIMQKVMFSLNQVLNDRHTNIFIENLRKYNKINIYKRYAIDKVNSLSRESVFEDRINSIQAICTVSHLKSSFFIDTHRYLDHLPVSVKVSYWNFDMLHSNKPYDVLDNLLSVISKNKEDQRLYFYFIRYYFSNDNIKSILSATNKNDTNRIAFLAAILYVYCISDKYHELDEEYKLISKTMKWISKSIPADLEREYQIIENIEAKFSIPAL
jgi:cell division protein ZapA (FtsZ GTPase activity inhibitor)